MFSTLIIVGILLGFCLVEFVLWALCLRLGLRWARVASVTMRRVIVATGSVFGIQLVLDVLFQLFAPSSAAQAVLVSIAAIAAAILIPCWVIMLLFSVRFLRSLQAWLPTLIPSVGQIAVALSDTSPLRVRDVRHSDQCHGPDIARQPLEKHVSGMRSVQLLLAC